MLKRRTDLPLDRDAVGRFLPWLVAFMVYLAVLALAGVLALGALAGRWDHGLAGTLTVQYQPAGDARTDAERTGTILRVLRATPGVVRADPVPEARVLALLEPWIGTSEVEQDLPLPRLIDVELDAGTEVDTAILTEKLRVVSPDLAIDDHRVWLQRLVRLISAVEGLALAVLGLIAFATVGTVVFTTRTGLAIHREVIEVLHLTGAHDSYIAGQFASRALVMGLKGGFLGLLLAAPTLWGLGWMAETLEAGILPEIGLTPLHWVLVVILPFLVALVAMVSARVTVMRSLARML